MVPMEEPGSKHGASVTSPRLGCSTISFRRRVLPEALALIDSLGIEGIDLGGLPGVCDHVPTPLVDEGPGIADAVLASGLATWGLNVDPGPLNDPALDHDTLVRRATPLVELASRLGSLLIVPCGAQSRSPFTTETEDLRRIADNLAVLADLSSTSGVRLVTEGLHHFRFCHSEDRALALLELVPTEVAGFVYDVSHVVASGTDEIAFADQVADRTEHVHLRDAVPETASGPGDINLSIGRGRADFARLVETLEGRGYQGRYVLELETHDVDEADRVPVAAQARDTIAGLLT
ncbi:Sugar phosphate isomerase/epimerase [Actinoalloteichus cyanogriseus DSM 43889]|uniref:Sugar phosphate isomerase/epimerase n=1 Tax=Actinoalloteichus caeruleus DSM 43889 TaxID=1120930 RepID=A0ABT1JD19_ACTCY|nr:Sugar phosphate isomerase/epimerase [Actinoalloteichus caeruleus DSM 43889]